LLPRCHATSGGYLAGAVSTNSIGRDDKNKMDRFSGIFEQRADFTKYF